jgi:hypothetical protein
MVMRASVRPHMIALVAQGAYGFWAESLIAGLALFLELLTLVRRDWIE